MKKSLLLGAVLLCATTMTGQRVSQQMKTQVKPTEDAMMLYDIPEPIAIEDEAAPQGVPHKVAPKADDGTPKAFYRRPAGAFYGINSGYDNNALKYSIYYTPYLFGWPHRTATYQQMARNIGQDPTYNWTYWVYSREDSARVEREASGEQLPVYYSTFERDSVPRLVAEGNDGYADYTLHGYNASGSGTSRAITGTYRSTYMAASDFKVFFNNTAERVLYCSSKYRSYTSNRDGTYIANGGYYYTSTSLLDTVENRKSSWYGRNNIGVEALAQAFEKPEHPYVLRSVGVAFSTLAMSGTEPVDLSVTVYKLDEIPAYNDSLSVYVDPDTCEVIATGTYTLDPEYISTNSITSGIFPFFLEEEDEETGLVFNVEPEIDFPILIVFTGYNNPNIAYVTLTQSADTYDEGFGELCYLGRSNEDGTLYYQGLNNLFSSGDRRTGLSIYVDVTHPWMTWNDFNETGEYNFAVEGEEHDVEVYCYSPAEEWDIALEDGSDIPSWLSFELEDINDSETGEWDNLTAIKATAAALPEGETYREAKVKFHFNGNYLVYTYTQGEKDEPEPALKGDINGDGIVDITDVNMVINMVLGKLDKTEAADIDGSGDVDITDVNNVINIMLGKE